MIRLLQVSKTYQTSDSVAVHALKNIDLTFGKCGMCFIVGKSGSGKSTLLNLLGRLDAATSGDIIFDGKTLGTMKRKTADDYRRNQVGFIFQSYNLIEEISVKDNLSLALMLKGNPAEERKIKEALISVGLEGCAERKPSELSGGQRQRVAIARALIKCPSLILADEPTGNLDSETSSEIFRILKRCSESLPVIVVTHDKESAMLYGDRIIELVDGEVASDQQLSKVISESAEEKIRETKRQKKFGIANTVKLGAKFLSRHWIRMLVTLILFAFAMTMFGAGFTAASYDANLTEYERFVLEDNPIVRIVSYPSVQSAISQKFHPYISKSQFEVLKHALPEVVFKGIYNYNDLQRTVLLHPPEIASNDEYSAYFQSGATSLEEEALADYGMKLMVGRMPSAVDEMALPKYVAERFLRYGIYESETQQYRAVENYQALEGEEVGELKIVGIIDTGIDLSQYEILKSVPQSFQTEKELEDYMRLKNKIQVDVQDAVHNAIFVDETYLNEHFLKKPKARAYSYLSLPQFTGIQKIAATYFSAITYDKLTLYKAKEFDDLQVNETVVSKETLKTLYYSKSGFQGNFQEITDNMLKDFLSKGAKLKVILSEEDVSFWNEKQTTEYDIVGYVEDEGKERLVSFYLDDATIDQTMNTQNIYQSIYTRLSGERQKDIKLFSTINDIQRENGGDNFSIAWNMRSDLDLNGENADNFAKLGLFSCIAFSIFAILMMMNFLSATIASSKKQIGILCALGASMKEVTGIYSLESLVIGISAFALSLPGIFGISYVMNDMLYQGSVQIPFMIVEYRQLLATFALGVITCAMGSILPIVRLAKKKPIEMIND